MLSADQEVGAGTNPLDLEARKARLPWIWQLPQRQRVPETPGPGTASDVDRFVLAKLRDKGLTPAPPADDRTWLRRVHFAITGLPLRRDEMQAFSAIPRRIAGCGSWMHCWRLRISVSAGRDTGWTLCATRNRVAMGKTSSSPMHGGTATISSARSTRDSPYDRFVAEHVAGDLLPPRLDPTTGANESVVATGWAFLGEENHSPVDIRLDECERVDNKVDVFSKAFLGLTVACARCHDHKFDAITQRDYYALSGFVLGSPVRQVRFETMEAHSRAAAQVAERRAEHAGKIAAAYSAAVRPALETMVPHLRGPPGGSYLGNGGGRLEVHWARGRAAHRLAQQLNQAAGDPFHPLR